MFIVQVAGRLGKDPETRFTPSGQKVTNLNVATNQRKGKEDITVWVRVTVWGEKLDKMISYLKKGSAVVVIGRMNPPSTYVDKEGRTQVALEVTAEMIEFSPFGKDDRSEGNQQAAGSTQEYSTQGNYEEPAYQGSAQSYSKPAYGSQSGGNAADDEALPF
jgi:single-strand DNA-binding protein